MTREEAKQMLPVIQAYAEGKTIQTKIKTDSTGLAEKWIDVTNPDLDGNPGCYRIKPEPTYRPFKDAEECWEEMQKHQPFGWLRHDGLDCMIHISYLLGEALTLEGDCLYTFENAFDKGYAFADGEPFGIIEEGLL